MKKRRYVLLGLVIGVGVLLTQTRAQEPLKSELGVRLGKALRPLTNETNHAEIVTGNVAYSGVAVSVLKADNPLQLINPFAPPKYGSTEDNTLRDSVSGRAIGLKILGIRF